MHSVAYNLQFSKYILPNFKATGISIKLFYTDDRNYP